MKGFKVDVNKFFLNVVVVLKDMYYFKLYYCLF